ncbi:MAG: hypothetical protein O2840_03520, partial [bacterium]|nr:hypothetical protein [bacterium]
NFVSALATVVGAFLAVFLIDDPTIIGIAIAISAGIFLYLGAIDFLPHVTHEGKKSFKNAVPLLVGILCMLLILQLVPHANE